MSPDRTEHVSTVVKVKKNYTKTLNLSKKKDRIIILPTLVRTSLLSAVGKRVKLSSWSLFWGVFWGFGKRVKPSFEAFPWLKPSFASWSLRSAVGKRMKLMSNRSAAATGSSHEPCTIIIFFALLILINHSSFSYKCGT